MSSSQQILQTEWMDWSKISICKHFFLSLQSKEEILLWKNKNIRSLALSYLQIWLDSKNVLFYICKIQSVT